VWEDLKEMGGLVETPMNALVMGQTIVTRTHCVPTVKARMFVVVLVVLLGMEEIVQIWTNVQALHQTSVILTPFVQTLKALMFVAV